MPTWHRAIFCEETFIAHETHIFYYRRGWNELGNLRALAWVCKSTTSAGRLDERLPSSNQSRNRRNTPRCFEWSVHEIRA